jgi:hypothetical protein
MFDYSSLSLALVSTGISPWHTMKSYEVPIIPCYPRWKSSRIRPQARMRPQERAVLRAVRDEQRNVRKYGIARFNKRCPLLASALWLISGYSTIWWQRFRLHMGYIYIYGISPVINHFLTGMHIQVVIPSPKPRVRPESSKVSVESNLSTPYLIYLTGSYVN